MTENKKKPNPIDVHVGSRIRLRRVLLGMSQEQLAAKMGFSFQQQQKYERGVNRVSASKLWQFSQVLDVPVSFFFDGLDGAVTEEAPAPFSLKRLDMEYARSFRALKDPLKRQAVMMVVRAMVASESVQTEDAA